MKTIIKHWKTISVCILISGLIISLCFNVVLYADLKRANNEIKAVVPLYEAQKEAAHDALVLTQKYEKAIKSIIQAVKIPKKKGK